ncbi:2-succinyl-5-enolpyruvyl-6-hydroxy-3-cyclohexene-1-carboxylate synthase [Ectothiorhodosinus mongolicus]|uniref:2-succinyl-5-enolpyruvyl-6-hydroxy-3-cyclohexene-1-carboxylate synthase n=1 Tax=Ectothiorhodosinus mongolicus TaxID=233100 RepID=A0A1R3W0R0_9GAMM|nr:2-succinyl-5-enolpyruvyl-6-hydroxy-3-cyclohexene-1-carboxylic-acid synthase [Ectothiorhodosinus mongolicus]ULX57313.1 2-succinyl-5-enolpyruvyl-6-hydroxy-3-cyclohexene-1-carboxylic-acid synthase [Ectothiorhodosinus mongolicus]SIT70923.1 2-succinyl-5-enolpyruvyl-6-hydroxy-3-cyclohexene-1-carboxylate synthase [Ectothiorhodosinus mongolicus]
MNQAISEANLRRSCALLQALYDHGVRELCVAPGSRSAPLVLAAVQWAEHYADISLHTHFDERGLGFFALGLIKASQRPVAVITTSGSAVANIHPAIVEARHSHLPLLAVTADRPSDLVGCGANQTIEQLDIFHPQVRQTLVLDELEATHAQDTLHKYLIACLSPASRGPGHINVPFREPLYAIRKPAWDLQRRQIPSGSLTAIDWAEMPTLDKRSLLVTGQLNQQEASAILGLAQRTGLSILGDVGSGLRLYAHPQVLNYASLATSHRECRQHLDHYEQVIQLGGRLVSKQLNQWLAEFPGDYWLIDSHGDSLDPSRRAQQRQADITAFCQGLKGMQAIDTQLTALQQWIEHELDDLLADGGSSLHLARMISQELPSDMTLMVGNSLSVRLVDWVSQARPDRLPSLLTQRGASGIDGLVATAMGAALHSHGGLSLLLGDLSLLHDLNSLALAKHQTKPLVIVVINDDGGGIFHGLPAREQKDIFKAFFQTPHGLQFADISAQFGLKYSAPESLAAFGDAYRQACAHPGVSLLEYKVVAEHTQQEWERLNAHFRGTAEPTRPA